MNRLRWMSTLALAATGQAFSADDGVPEFTDAGELVRPADYRQWVFVGSGLGMAYGPVPSMRGDEPSFTNVFVNPPAFQAYTENGVWPDGTHFLLEVRESEQHVSIDGNRRTQGRLLLLESSVKDGERFPEDGWAYFSFEAQDETAAPLPRNERCYSCHAEHGAVEWTFTQFYHDLFELARNHGTVRADYDPARELDAREGDRNAAR